MHCSKAAIAPSQPTWVLSRHVQPTNSRVNARHFVSSFKSSPPHHLRSVVIITATVSDENQDPEQPTTASSSEPQQQQQQQQDTTPSFKVNSIKDPQVERGQRTAIITGAISIIFGVAYLALVQFMDLRGGELLPPPPEAYIP